MSQYMNPTGNSKQLYPSPFIAPDNINDALDLLAQEIENGDDTWAQQFASATPIQASPALSFRAVGQENTTRKMAPSIQTVVIRDRQFRILMPSQLQKIFSGLIDPQKTFWSRFFIESELKTYQDLYVAEQDSFHPREHLGSLFHQAIAGLVQKSADTDLKSKKLDDTVVNYWNRFCNEMALIAPNDSTKQELIEVAARFHIYHHYWTTVGTLDNSQATALMRIATQDNLYTLPELDVNERPLTIAGKVSQASSLVKQTSLSLLKTAAQAAKSTLATQAAIAQNTSQRVGAEITGTRHMPLNLPSLIPPSAQLEEKSWLSDLRSALDETPVSLPAHPYTAPNTPQDARTMNFYAMYFNPQQ